jgi:hypothetical protein
VSSAANTGDANIRTGNTLGSGNSGNISLSTGTSASGARGQVQISASTLDVNADSEISLVSQGSAELVSDTADAIMFGQTAVEISSSGSALIAADSVVIQSSQNGSAVKTLTIESLGIAAETGAVTVRTGNSSANASGNMAISTGSAAANFDSGDISLTTGTTSGTGVRGAVSVNALHLSMNSSQIKDLANPVLGTDAVNLQTLQAYQEGLKPKTAARVATTANISLATDLEAADVIDGVTLVAGDRVLVKDQSTASQNGVYIVQASGAAVRATDFDSTTPIDEINGAYLFVSEGTANAGKAFVVTAPVVSVVNTDAINWVFFNSAATLSAGNGIDISSNVISARLLASGGLKFVSGEIAVEPADFAGDGLVDDGSDNLAIDWATVFTVDSADAKAVKASDLASTSVGKGASIIGVQDANGYFSANNQEGVNNELYTLASQGSGVFYTVGAGGVTKGALVYISANNTVLPYSDITVGENVVGVALATVAAAGQVQVARLDKVVTGVLSGATAGDEYYWNGSAYVTTPSNVAGEYVYLVGIAKNATDLSLELEMLYVNS